MREGKHDRFVEWLLKCSCEIEEEIIAWYFCL